jgi:peptidoglycan/xylan/chitin deacetylase (PgdA/CDA1 family)
MTDIKTRLISNPAVRKSLRSAARLPFKLLSASSALDYLYGSRSERVAILCYHGVSDLPPKLGEHRYVGTAEFEQQMQYLANKANVMPLQDLIDAIQNNEAIPPKTLAITFDDGLAHLMQTAVPVLERFGLTATFLVVTKAVDNHEPIWTDQAQWIVENHPPGQLEFEFEDSSFHLSFSSREERMASLTKVFKFGQSCGPDVLGGFISRLRQTTQPAFGSMRLFENSDIEPMSWEQVKELLSKGQSVGSHTRTHCIVSRCGPESMKDELLNSRLRIEDKIGTSCRMFAYPNGNPGNFDQTTGEILSESGYDCGLTTEFGFVTSGSQLMSLPRVGVSRSDSLGVFKAKLCGLWWNGPLS